MFYRSTFYVRNKLYNIKSLHNFREERNFVFNDWDQSNFHLVSLSYKDKNDECVGSIHYHQQTGEIYDMYINNPKYINRNLNILMIKRVETLLKQNNPEVKELWIILPQMFKNSIYEKVLTQKIILSPILVKYFIKL